MKKSIWVVGLVLLVFGFVALKNQSKDTSIVAAVDKQVWPFQLPELPYEFSALEPSIDAETVDIHYSRHHQAYVTALNNALADTSYQKMTLQELFSIASKLPQPVVNFAGGHWNHTFYWSIMRSPVDNPGPSKRLQKVLENTFGSVDAFKREFVQAGLKEFGSGWAWLVQKRDGTLEIVATNDQDNPLMNTAEVRGKPLLTCDVWEHAYYLKYLNRRDLYLESFWDIVNWERVEELLNQ